MSTPHSACPLQVFLSLLIVGCLWLHGVDAGVHADGARRRTWWSSLYHCAPNSSTHRPCRSTQQKGGQRSGREGQPSAGRLCGAPGRIHRQWVLWGWAVQQRGLRVGRRRLLPRDLRHRRVQVRQVERVRLQRPPLPDRCVDESACCSMLAVGHHTLLTHSPSRTTQQHLSFIPSLMLQKFKDPLATGALHHTPAPRCLPSPGTQQHSRCRAGEHR